MVQIEDIGTIRRLTLNRPEKLNALNDALVAELISQAKSIEADPGVRVVVITGNQKAFAAGADIDDFFSLSSAAQAYDWVRQRCLVYAAIAGLSKPVVAALSGFTLGGGLELALAADLRLASQDVRLGFPEIDLGLLPGGGGIQRLVRLVGPAQAKEVLLTGRRIEANEALRLGLVNRVVPEADLQEEALKLAGELAGKPPQAIKLIKTAVDRAAFVEKDLGEIIEQQAFALLFSTQDMREGIQAFSERRRPRFTGK